MLEEARYGVMQVVLMKFNAVQLCIIYGSMHLISQEIIHCLLLDFTRLIFDKLHPSGLANNELYFKKTIGCQITCWYSARRQRKNNLMS